MDFKREWDSASSCFRSVRTISRFGYVVDISDFRTIARYLVLRGRWKSSERVSDERMCRSLVTGIEPQRCVNLQDDGKREN